MASQEQESTKKKNRKKDENENENENEPILHFFALTSSARSPYPSATVTHAQLGTTDPHKLSSRLPPANGAIAHATATSTHTHAGAASTLPPVLVLLLPLLPPLLLLAASEEVECHTMWENDHSAKHRNDMPLQTRPVSRLNTCKDSRRSNVFLFFGYNGVVMTDVLLMLARNCFGMI